jgi:hypothetical protein
MKKPITWFSIIVLILAGCASNPSTNRLSYAEYRAKLSPSAAEMGRIWFYRTHVFFGDGIQPQVNLDWKHVGSSMPGYFYMVEIRAGYHEVETITEWPQKAIVVVKTNEDSYVKLSSRPGVAFGHVVPVVVPEKEALPTLKNLKSLK